MIRFLILFLAATTGGFCGEITVERETDAFKGTSTVSVKQGDIVTERKKIVGAVSRVDGEDILQLVLMVLLDDWSFLGEEAIDDTQNELQIDGTDRETAGRGGVLEAVAVRISKDWLESRLEGETQIKVYGKRGDEIFTVSEQFKQRLYQEAVNFTADEQ